MCQGLHWMVLINAQKVTLLFIVGHYGIEVSRQLKKQVIKVDIYEALVEKVILPPFELKLLSTLLKCRRCSQT